MLAKPVSIKSNELCGTIPKCRFIRLFISHRAASICASFCLLESPRFTTISCCPMMADSLNLAIHVRRSWRSGWICHWESLAGNWKVSSTSNGCESCRICLSNSPAVSTQGWTRHQSSGKRSAGSGRRKERISAWAYPPPPEWNVGSQQINSGKLAMGTSLLGKLKAISFDMYALYAWLMHASTHDLCMLYARSLHQLCVICVRYYICIIQSKLTTQSITKPTSRILRRTNTRDLILGKLHVIPKFVLSTQNLNICCKVGTIAAGIGPNLIFDSPRVESDQIWQSGHHHGWHWTKSDEICRR